MSWEVAALAGATILQAGGQLAAGAAQARAQRQMAGQYKQMQQEAKVQTLQEEVARRGRFMEMTGSNIADAAFRGLTPDSASFGAISDENRRQFETEMANVRFMGDARMRQLGLASRMANQAASAARMQSYFAAGTTLASGGFRYYQTMSGSAPTTGSTGPTGQSYASELSQGLRPI